MQLDNEIQKADQAWSFSYVAILWLGDCFRQCSNQWRGSAPLCWPLWPVYSKPLSPNPSKTIHMPLRANMPSMTKRVLPTYLLYMYSSFNYTNYIYRICHLVKWFGSTSSIDLLLWLPGPDCYTDSPNLFFSLSLSALSTWERQNETKASLRAQWLTMFWFIKHSINYWVFHKARIKFPSLQTMPSGQNITLIYIQQDFSLQIL